MAAAVTFNQTIKWLCAWYLCNCYIANHSIIAIAMSLHTVDVIGIRGQKKVAVRTGHAIQRRCSIPLLPQNESGRAFQPIIAQIAIIGVCAVKVPAVDGTHGAIKRYSFTIAPAVTRITTIVITRMPVMAFSLECTFLAHVAVAGQDLPLVRSAWLQS